MKTNNFFLIAGPCVVEEEPLMDQVAREVSGFCRQLNIDYIFKSSYYKANRTQLSSYTGLGMREGLEMIRRVAQKYGVRSLTDVHTEQEADIAAEYVDILQIPAFLCRQTPLLVAAARTGKCVNIKKGQFMSATAMGFAVEKILQSGGQTPWLTERGTTFGYEDLVVDFRNLPLMKQFGCPVVMDCTHSLQKPNQVGGKTGGTPEFVDTMAKAAVAVGADGLFIETHPDPKNAKSDGANMLPLHKIGPLLNVLVSLKKALP